MPEFGKRRVKSLIAEWVLKVALLFFVVSLFVSTEAIQAAQEDGSSNLGFITWLKISVILLYTVGIAAITQSTFKIIGFSTIIVGAIYKILLAMSVDTFAYVDFISLADEILLIAVSYFYLYRHHRHEKKAKKVVKKKTKHS